LPGLDFPCSRHPLSSKPQHRPRIWIFWPSKLPGELCRPSSSPSFVIDPNLKPIFPDSTLSPTMASRAIPSHLKPSAAAGNRDAESFARKHHGKTQSHVVSGLFCFQEPRYASSPSYEPLLDLRNDSIHTLEQHSHRSI
jgi:hypothetical protein